MALPVMIDGLFANPLGSMVLALLLGCLIGLERQLRHHVAGLHTHALVTLGSAAFVVISAVVSDGSATRVAAQVSSGIGFLGAGAILRDGLSIRGLNTAATLWCGAAVGALCGIQKPLLAVEAAALVLLANILLHSCEDWLIRKPDTPP